jgi:hypothetical protein
MQNSTRKTAADTIDKEKAAADARNSTRAATGLKYSERRKRRADAKTRRQMQARQEKRRRCKKLISEKRRRQMPNRMKTDGQVEDSSDLNRLGNLALNGNNNLMEQRTKSEEETGSMDGEETEILRNTTGCICLWVTRMKSSSKASLVEPTLVEQNEYPASPNEMGSTEPANDALLRRIWKEAITSNFHTDVDWEYEEAYPFYDTLPFNETWIDYFQYSNRVSLYYKFINRPNAFVKPQLELFRLLFNPNAVALRPVLPFMTPEEAVRRRRVDGSLSYEIWTSISPGFGWLVQTWRRCSVLDYPIE